MTTAEIIATAFDLLSPLWIWLAYRAGAKRPAAGPPPPSGDGVRAAVERATAAAPESGETKPAAKRRGRPPKRPPEPPAAPAAPTTPTLPM